MRRVRDALNSEKVIEAVPDDVVLEVINTSSIRCGNLSECCER